MLFLNAGMVYSAATEEGHLRLSEDGIETIFATNVVGHHLMYRLLESSIRSLPRTTPARIVQTSSCASYRTFFPFRVATDLETLNGIRPLDTNNLYGQSKLAQILWTRELTDRIDAEEKPNDKTNTNNNDPNSVVFANAAHPGAVATNLWSTIDWERYALGRFVPLIAATVIKIMWTAEEGALTLLYLGTAVDRLRTNNTRGQYFHPQATLMTDHKFARDNDQETKDLQVRLWKFLDELVADFL